MFAIAVVNKINFDIFVEKRVSKADVISMFNFKEGLKQKNHKVRLVTLSKGFDCFHF